MTRTPKSPMFRLSPLLVLIATCCPIAALAQGAAPATAGKGPAMVWIGDLDANHDGRITAQEAAAVPAIAQSFAGMDANKDGSLTMTEVRLAWRAMAMNAAQATVPGRMAAYAKADANHDGKLTADEAKAGMPRIAANFKSLDTSKDGTLSKEEVAAGAQMAVQIVLVQKRQGEAQLFGKADANHDNKLNQAEFTAAFPKLAPSFAFFDENHDGSVEPAEFALPPR